MTDDQMRDFLRQVARGAVVLTPDGEIREYDDRGGYVRAEGKLTPAIVAGFVRRGGNITDGAYKHPSRRAYRWQLTRDGERVVHRPEPENEPSGGGAA